jgi:hypothetical protein
MEETSNSSGSWGVIGLLILDPPSTDGKALLGM